MAMMKVNAQKIQLFIGVVDFVASVDAVVQEHLQSVNVTVFLKEHLRQYRMNSLF